MRPAIRTAGCHACRSLVLRQFVSSHAPLVTARARAVFPAVATPGQLPLRTRWNSTLQSPAGVQAGTRPAENEAPDRESAAAEPTEEEPEANEDEVPWYLQVEPPRHPTLVHEPPSVPDVPRDSPKVVGPLLTYAVEELGLDDLNLLDLRSLDPPASLGPKLIMLFGTARSERHLHVAASRLVGWLRGYGITADADGLLGRNELKIRLRRKARKAKLLGRSPGSDADDGISTRWICVNLGTIGWKSEETEIISADGRSSGFGTPQTGTTIVVQLFTDARRKELDLESLWSRILKRDGAQEIVDDNFPLADGQSEVTRSADASLPSQRRFFSTSARRFATADVAASPSYRALSDLVQVRSLDRQQKSHALDQLEADLKRLPRSEMVAALAPADPQIAEKRSEFMRQWQSIIGQLPSAESWGLRVWLHRLGASLAHPAYDIGQLTQLVTEMQLSAIDATREQYLQLLESCYLTPAAEEQSNMESQRSSLALKLMETMYERGEPVLANDVLVTLIESLVRSGKGPEAETAGAALEQLLTQAKLPCMNEALLIRLMDAYASQENWDRFWEVWRIPPKFMKARSPAMYAYVYGRLAQTRHQARCIDGVRRCLQEMLNENPPVQPEGAVVDNLKMCIDVADPDAARIARDFVIKSSVGRKMAKREFIRILLDLKLF